MSASTMVPVADDGLRMRILFVNGTASGGSLRSTEELASVLRARGHEVALLMQSRRGRVARYVYKRQVNLATKLEGSMGEGWGHRLSRVIGRRPHARDHLDTWQSTVPENASSALARRFRPDVVVAASISRVGWRRIRAQAIADGVATALYLREASALGHLTVSKAPPDVLLGNASQYLEDAAALGYRGWLVPSIVDTDSCRINSTRQRVLLVNPISSHGVDLTIELARARPDVRFTFRESWPLSRRDWSRLEQRVAQLGNVCLSRSIDDPTAVYAEARILLVPHGIDNRPRVIAEAQANGIPVLASRLPGLIEAVGPGGLLVGIGEPLEVWAEALSRLWDEPDLYDHYAAAAAAHARRPEIDPESIVTAFEEAIATAVPVQSSHVVRSGPDG